MYELNQAMKSNSSSIKHAIYVECIFIYIVMNIYKLSIRHATCKIVFPLRQNLVQMSFQPKYFIIYAISESYTSSLFNRIGISLLGFSLKMFSFLFLVRDYATEIKLRFVYYRLITYDAKQRKYIKKQKIVLLYIKRMLGQTFQWQFGQSFRSNHYPAHPLII